MDETGEAERGGLGRAVGWARARPLLVVVPVWLAAQLGWLRAFRWTRYAELDEAGYMAMSSRMTRPLPWSARWHVLSTEGVFGPLQSLLAAPVMKLTAIDLRALIALNIALVAVAAIATAALTRRLASRPAGTVAAVLVLLGPGVLEFSRTALTAVAPMTFAALALAALARSHGMRDTRWTAAAGVAMGAMVLGRSMAIGFLPAIAVAGLGWAWSTGAPWRRALANGVLAAAATIVTAGWWWWIRWADVSDYLFGGGSSDTDRIGNRAEKVVDHGVELAFVVGPAAVVAAGAAAILAAAAWRRRGVGAGPVSEPTSDAPLAVWPLAASVATGFVALGASSAPGVGFVLPLVPATVAAGVAALRRASSATPRRTTAVTAALVAVAATSAVALPGRGMDLSTVWCRQADPAVIVQCDIRSNSEGLAWRYTVDAVSDRIATIEVAVADAGGPVDESLVAMTPQDFGVSPNAVGLSLELRHTAPRSLSHYFLADEAPEQQVSRVVDEAGVLVVVDDSQGYRVFGKHVPPSAEIITTARAGGFRPCDEVPMPDGRAVTILVAEWVPDVACAPLPGG